MTIWLYLTEAKNIRRKKNKKERKPNIAQTKVLGLQPYSQQFMESVKYKFLSAVWKTVEVMVDKMG